MSTHHAQSAMSDNQSHHQKGGHTSRSPSLGDWVRMGLLCDRGECLSPTLELKAKAQAVRTTGCTVDTLTLSSQQKVLAEERIKAAGLAGRIRVWLLDYRK